MLFQIYLLILIIHLICVLIFNKEMGKKNNPQNIALGFLFSVLWPLFILGVPLLVYAAYASIIEYGKTL